MEGYFVRRCVLLDRMHMREKKYPRRVAQSSTVTTTGSLPLPRSSPVLSQLNHEPAPPVSLHPSLVFPPPNVKHSTPLAHGVPACDASPHGCSVSRTLELHPLFFQMRMDLFPRSLTHHVAEP